MGSATVFCFCDIILTCVSCAPRIDAANYVHHILNRANARVQIFDDDNDLQPFELILEDAVQRYDMRLLSYCIMPNHWRLVLHPKKDGDLSLFMGWLTNTHTRRWHVSKDTIGERPPVSR